MRSQAYQPSNWSNIYISHAHSIILFIHIYININITNSVTFRIEPSTVFDYLLKYGQLLHSFVGKTFFRLPNSVGEKLSQLDSIYSLKLIQTLCRIPKKVRQLEQTVEFTKFTWSSKQFWITSTYRVLLNWILYIKTWFFFTLQYSYLWCKQCHIMKLTFQI